MLLTTVAGLKCCSAARWLAPQAPRLLHWRSPYLPGAASTRAALAWGSPQTLETTRRALPCKSTLRYGGWVRPCMQAQQVAATRAAQGWLHRHMCATGSTTNVPSASGRSVPEYCTHDMKPPRATDLQAEPASSETWHITRRLLAWFGHHNPPLPSTSVHVLVPRLSTSPQWT